MCIRDRDFEQSDSPLRPVEDRLEAAGTGAGTPAPPPPLGIENPTAELVADLIEATGLVPLDRLALVRGAARQGATVAEALVLEGLASSEGVARMLAARLEEAISFGATEICMQGGIHPDYTLCLLYTSPSPRDRTRARMPSSA